MKLLAFLQSQGFSRRAITAQIRDGKVFVQGEKVESYGYEVNEGDEVRYGDVVIIYNRDACNASVQENGILLFYKPAGYVCSKSDPHNATIYEILPPEYKHWYYIGRLDRESRGLVLLTSDPKLVDQYEHPRHGITKEYVVKVNKPFKEEDKERCLIGIESDGEMLHCLHIQILEGDSFVITLNEGKKRHIRRMMSALRYHVEDLLRVREGTFVLDDMKEGDWKLV